MLKSKVTKIIATALIGTTALGVVWTGGEIIQNAKDFITGADAKVIQARENIDTLKDAVTSKKDKIKELTTQIDALQKELESDNNASLEEIDNLKAQIQEKLTKIESLNTQIIALNTQLEEASTENNRLTAELNKANADVEELKAVLDATQSSDVTIETSEEIQAFINEGADGGSGDSGDSDTMTPVNDNITWNTDPQGSTQATGFINSNKDAITGLFTTNGISTKGVVITVTYVSNVVGYDLVNIGINGLSTGDKAIITKSAISGVITGKYSIEKVFYTNN